MRINIIVVAITAAGFTYGQFGVTSTKANAPFSAETVTTQVQTLVDGTHITQPEQTTKLCRDSLGRTRSEMYRTPPAGSQQTQPVMTNITIVDSVEGVRYFLNPNNKTAQRIVTPQGNRPPAPAPAAAIGSTATGVIGGFQSAVQFYPGPAGAINGRPPGTGNAAGGPQSKNESLGTQTIEGLIAEGHRTTTTWPAGTMGNDRDIVTSNETWQSTELGILVLSRSSDPRTGERTTKLINVSRSEPDPALFRVPSDYTIEEGPKPAGSPAGTPAPAH